MLSQLLGVFLSSPLLEDIHLTLFALLVEPGASHRLVTLPRLRKLSLFSTSASIPILTSIALPPSASVLARIEADVPSPRGLILSLGQHLSPLISGSDELIISHPVTSIRSILHFKKGGETRVSLEHFGYRHPLLLEETLIFTAACPLDTIRRLVINGRMDREVASDRVSRMMREMGNVETLILENAAHLIPLLLPTTQGDQNPCPTLKTLTIDDDEEINHQELVSVVKARAEAGFPLQRVVFHAVGSEEVAGELRRFVEDGKYTEFRQ
jgi:hypothetical protein